MHAAYLMYLFYLFSVLGAPCRFIFLTRAVKLTHQLMR